MLHIENKEQAQNSTNDTKVNFTFWILLSQYRPKLIENKVFVFTPTAVEKSKQKQVGDVNCISGYFYIRVSVKSFITLSIVDHQGPGKVIQRIRRIMLYFQLQVFNDFLHVFNSQVLNDVAGAHHLIFELFVGNFCQFNFFTYIVFSYDFSLLYQKMIILLLILFYSEINSTSLQIYIVCHQLIRLKCRAVAGTPT